MAGLMKEYLRSLATGQQNPIRDFVSNWETRKQNMLNNEIQRRRLGQADERIGLSRQSNVTAAQRAATDADSLDLNERKFKYQGERDQTEDFNAKMAPIRRELGSYGADLDAPQTSSMAIPPLPLGSPIGFNTPTAITHGPTEQAIMQRVAAARQRKMDEERKNKVSTASGQATARENAKIAAKKKMRDEHLDESPIQSQQAIRALDAQIAKLNDAARKLQLKRDSLGVPIDATPQLAQIAAEIKHWQEQRAKLAATMQGQNPALTLPQGLPAQDQSAPPPGVPRQTQSPANPPSELQMILEMLKEQPPGQ